ncbi:hypothetical protein BDW74DRAFT_83923 [Aspergillus multicolor]|uniref:meroterpenoid cyclase pyr4 n=1 Tax=Aspergillus multicolor TaxID=41759 RepID=UPI003CCDE964
MDGFDVSQAPPEYHAIKRLADLLTLGTGLGWLINYAGMVYISFRDQTYAMAIIPLCSNIAWEIVYSVVYPSKYAIEHAVFLAGLAINFAIIYAAVRFAPHEWSHAPLVRDNMPAIFTLGILGCLSGHLALAAEIGHALAYSWSAVICQMLLSIGGLCQLLCRNSSRGASYVLWLSRFFGSWCVVGVAALRWKYWPEAFGWLDSPMILWSLAVFVLVDGFYGVCLWHVKREEETQVVQKKQR